MEGWPRVAWERVGRSERKAGAQLSLARVRRLRLASWTVSLCAPEPPTDVLLRVVVSQVSYRRAHCPYLVCNVGYAQRIRTASARRRAFTYARQLGASRVRHSFFLRWEGRWRARSWSMRRSRSTTGMRGDSGCGCFDRRACLSASTCYGRAARFRGLWAALPSPPTKAG